MLADALHEQDVAQAIDDGLLRGPRGRHLLSQELADRWPATAAGASPRPRTCISAGSAAIKGAAMPHVKAGVSVMKVQAVPPPP